MIAVLGRAPSKADTGEGVALRYADITVQVGWLEKPASGKQRRVFQVTATGANICTPSGICPGTTVTKVMATYGQPVSSKRETGKYLEYYSHQSSCWLQLSISGGAVQTISAVCQP
ncbi:hypothetical protein [Undibacterium danionis]|uniref:Uncharacterized protein n=1 Tax=Undibacterium danionis TaxID=1812100 RepID=A0ABV6IFY7_9BURK